MKKALFILVCLLFSVSLFSQDEVKETSKKRYGYCELVGTGGVFSTKVKISIDFGQEVSFWNQDRKLRDDNGKAVKFNSMVDAMNYMGDQGWEFVQAYVVTSGNQNVYHWLLKIELGEAQDE